MSAKVRRWGAITLLVVLAAAAVVAALNFVPDLISERARPNQAGYMGLIFGCLGILIALGPVAAKLLVANRTELKQKLREQSLRRLTDRYDAMRSGDDIELRLVTPTGRELDLADAWLSANPPRMLLLGPTGSGKTYTSVRLALRRLSVEGPVPVIFPASRLNVGDSANTRLGNHLGEAFSMQARVAASLVASGTVLPIIDGLDELPETEARALLQDLSKWRVLGDPAAFVLTCRDSEWARLSAGLRVDLLLASVQPVDETRARAYLESFLADRVWGPEVASLVLSSARSRRKSWVFRKPWTLTLLAASLEETSLTDQAPSPDKIAAFVDSLNERMLYDGLACRAIAQGKARTRDLETLSTLARYLYENRTLRLIDGHVLSAQDIVLHELWPICGEWRPRVADLLLCIAFSLPGLIWGWSILWPLGVSARMVASLGTVLYCALLVRTSMKSWVPPATPDWSRLRQPRYTLRQSAASITIGLLGWAFFGPEVAVLCLITAWLAIGLTVGFGQTLTTDSRLKAAGPEGVLNRERLVSMASAAVVTPLLGFGFSYSLSNPLLGWLCAAAYGACVGLTVASALSRRYLAMLLSAFGLLPIRLTSALRRLEQSGLLRDVGGGYQLRHSRLIEYFAQNADDELGAGRAPTPPSGSGG